MMSEHAERATTSERALSSILDAAQTPPELAAAICTMLSKIIPPPRAILERSAGLGNRSNLNHRRYKGDRKSFRSRRSNELGNLAG